MPLPDPTAAPPRTDLPWLRHRAAAPASSSPGPSAPAPSAPAPSAPAPSAPAPSAPAPSAPAPSSLDLDEPAAPAVPPTRTAPAVPTGRPAGPVRETRPPGRVYVAPRVTGRGRLRLTAADPTVTLTRRQTGIGTLTVEAAVSDQTGDLRLGAAYELADGVTGTVQSVQGARHAPPDSRRPVLVAGHERFERILVDCRQCARLRRMVVYAFSETRRALSWDGTLTVETFGGARVEVPMQALAGGEVAALLSVCLVRGQFVLRAELQPLAGDVRDVCRAYGFDRISWVDSRTPLQ